MLARRKQRKRGISVENVMLGLIVVLIFSGLLYGASSMVMRNVRNAQAARVLPPAVSEIRRLFVYRSDFVELDDDLVIRSGVIPADMIDQDGPRILMPYDGTVTFEGTNADGTFTATVSWPSGRGMETALCTKLAVDDIGDVIETGPLGENYVMEDRDCLADEPYFVARYQR